MPIPTESIGGDITADHDQEAAKCVESKRVEQVELELMDTKQLKAELLAKIEELECKQKADQKEHRAKIEEFGIVPLKEKILAEMTKADFAVSGENFIDNYSENTKMGVEAMKELCERNKELFGSLIFRALIST
uniref:Uncharacterized protein n=1 Tax=Globodera rostochiensis TaxID=31243 RepID=A0A914HG48_GLORO